MLSNALTGSIHFRSDFEKWWLSGIYWIPRHFFSLKKKWKLQCTGHGWESRDSVWPINLLLCPRTQKQDVNPVAKQAICNKWSLWLDIAGRCCELAGKKSWSSAVHGWENFLTILLRKDLFHKASWGGREETDSVLCILVHKCKIHSIIWVKSYLRLF